MFKNRLDPAKVIMLGICMVLLSVGCQPTTDEDDQTAIVTQIIPGEIATALPTVTPVMPSRLIVPSVTPTQTVISLPTSSSVLGLTPTFLPTETITPTLWPTLSPNEAANKVISLLSDNHNPDCLLPCWWGATPGQTYWQDIEPFLNSLAKTIHYSSSGTSFGAEVILPLPQSVAVLNSSDYHAFYGWGESGIIHGIQIAPINISGYDAKTMVTFYGVPDEVWLKTLDAPREGVLPFQLIIVYQQLGISFRYYVDASTNGEIVTACFEPGIETERPDLFPANPRIYVWEPGQYKEIEVISPIPGETYFPLEAKTDLTLETLHERFTNPDEQPCVDTPVDAWR